VFVDQQKAAIRDMMPLVANTIPLHARNHKFDGKSRVGFVAAKTTGKRMQYRVAVIQGGVLTFVAYRPDKVLRDQVDDIDTFFLTPSWGKGFGI
jgi:hypothetical protein